MSDKFKLPDDCREVFDREWAVKDDYGYSEVHVTVVSNGVDYYWRSCYGGTFHNANGSDQAKLAGKPDLDKAQKVKTGKSLSRGWVPNPGDEQGQAEMALVLFGVGFVPGTYLHNAW